MVPRDAQFRQVEAKIHRTCSGRTVNCLVAFVEGKAGVQGPTKAGKKKGRQGQSQMISGNGKGKGTGSSSASGKGKGISKDA